VKANSRKAVPLVWGLTGILVCLSLFSLVYSFEARQTTGRDVFTLAGDVLWGLLPVGFACLAGLVLSRQSHNLIGWLLMLPAVALAAGGAYGTYFHSFADAPAHPSLVFLLVLWFDGWSWLLLIFPVFFILLLFPTGQPVSARWRWVTLYVLAVCVCFFILIAFGPILGPQDVSWFVKNPVGVIPEAWTEKYSVAPFGIGLLTVTALSVASIFARYRSAQTVEREQIKWLLSACGLFAAVYVGTILPNLLNSPNVAWSSGLWYVLGPVALMMIPAAIAIAILKYRLWDIEVVIRKTLVYSALTVLLALVYFGSVVLLQWLFGLLTGVEQSPLAIVVSTLVIAALFTPLRRRIQGAIDRRFYRKKYDAQQVLAQFAITARDETDLDALTAELMRVAQDTMQPERVSVWLSRQTVRLRAGDPAQKGTYRIEGA
jgi:hypothetical protein